MRWRVLLILLFLMPSMWALNHFEFEQVVNRIFEYLSEQEEESVDYDLLYEKLLARHNVPINLNATSREELEELGFLSDLQVENILYYLYRFGPCYSVYELQLVEGLDRFALSYLLPFVVVNTSDTQQFSWKEKLRRVKHELIVKSDMPFEMASGYKNGNYLGNSLGLNMRYKATLSNSGYLGFAVEQDKGEPFVYEGSPGFDNYKVYLQLNNVGPMRRIILGDYKVTFGEGLLFNGNSNWFSTGVLDVGVRNEGIERHTSMDEYRFMRGVGGTYQRGAMQATVFYSYRLWDADTVGAEFQMVQTGGLHRTLLEISKRHAVSSHLIGGNIKYELNRWRFGLTGYGLFWNMPMITGKSLYRVYYPQGYWQGGVSGYYRYRSRQLHASGELAVAHNGALATIHTVTLTPTALFALALSARYYSPKYHSLYAGGYALGGSTTNETGIYLAAELNAIPKWKFALSSDIVYYPWLKYGVDAPSVGSALQLRGDYLSDEGIKLTALLRYRYKEETVIVGDRSLRYLQGVDKLSFKLQAAYSWSCLEFKHRIEGNGVWAPAFSGGFLMTHGVKVSIAPWRMALGMVYELFNAPSYDNRFYVYEQGMPYLFASTQLYGTGNRYYFNLRWSPWRFMNLYVRFAQTIYGDGRTFSGSGNDRIDGVKKSDIHFLIVGKF